MMHSPETYSKFCCGYLETSFPSKTFLYIMARDKLFGVVDMIHIDEKLIFYGGHLETSFPSKTNVREQVGKSVYTWVTAMSHS